MQAQGAELDGSAEEGGDADSSAERAEGEPLIADYEGDAGSYVQEDEYAAALPEPTQAHTKPLTAPKGMQACYRLCLIASCCCKGAL